LAVLRIAATSLAVVVTATLVAGCGGSGHSPAEAHLAALANGVCREVGSMGTHDRLKAELAELRTQLNSDQQLPRVATYVADAQASARLQAALSKLSYKEYGPAGSTLLKESSRLERKIQSDLKALGWTACTGQRLGSGAR
jgi:hypothetical protein